MESLTIDGPGSLVPSLFASNIVLLSLAITAVVLRFWSRKINKAGYGWDDWLVLQALLLGMGEVAIGAFWIHIGGGKYIGQVTPEKLRKAYLVIFITEIFYAICCFLIRASTLVLWTRIFFQRWVRWYSYAWRIANALWTLASIVITCLQCQPLGLFFEPLNPEYLDRCHVNIKQFILAVAVSSVLIDAAIIMLPVVICCRLNLNLTTKLVVCGMFATGFFVSIVSIIRVETILKIDLHDPKNGLNPTWIFAPTGLWTGVEMHVGIISTCLPCIRPALAKLMPSALVPISLRPRPVIPYSIRNISIRERSSSADTPKGRADSV